VRCVLGIDPGFASIGYAVVSLHSTGESVIEADVFHTSKSNRKLRVRSADDNFRRTQEFSRFLRHLVEHHRVDAICAEAMSFPRSSSVAAKMALTWGVLGTMAELFNRPVLSASPIEIKAAVCGTKTASKEDIISTLTARYECAAALEHLPMSQREHACDAIGAVVACLHTDVLQMVRQLAAAEEIQTVDITPRRFSWTPSAAILLDEMHNEARNEPSSDETTDKRKG
jgi:crossover junction endodeoxyribonuclease RuvC